MAEFVAAQGAIITNAGTATTVVPIPLFVDGAITNSDFSNPVFTHLKVIGALDSNGFATIQFDNPALPSVPVPSQYQAFTTTIAIPRGAKSITVVQSGGGSVFLQFGHMVK